MSLGISPQSRWLAG